MERAWPFPSERMLVCMLLITAFLFAGIALFGWLMIVAPSSFGTSAQPPRDFIYDAEIANDARRSC